MYKHSRFVLTDLVSTYVQTHAHHTYVCGMYLYRSMPSSFSHNTDPVWADQTQGCLTHSHNVTTDPTQTIHTHRPGTDPTAFTRPDQPPGLSVGPGWATRSDTVPRTGPPCTLAHVHHGERCSVTGWAAAGGGERSGDGPVLQCSANEWRGRRDRRKARSSSSESDRPVPGVQVPAAAPRWDGYRYWVVLR